MRTSESPPKLAVSTSQPYVPFQPISLKGSSIKGESRVFDSAQVVHCNLKGAVEISGSVQIKHSNVSGTVRIGEQAVIAHSTLSDNASVRGNALIKHSKIRENSLATDKVQLAHMTLKGNARAGGEAEIKHSTIEEDSVVEGHSIVKHSTLKGRSLVTSDSEVIRCNIIDSVICHGAKVSDSNFTKHWICGMQRTQVLDDKFAAKNDERVLEHLGTFSPVSPFYSEPSQSLPPPTPSKDRINPNPVSRPVSRPPAQPTPAYADPKEAPPSYDEVTSPDSTARRLGSLRIDHSRVDEKTSGFGGLLPPDKS